MEATNWQHAVAQALDQNDHQRAKQLLAGVIRQNPQEREAWRILATIVTDPAQQAECLRRIAAIDAAAPAITPLAKQPSAEPMPSPERRILSIAKKTIPLADAQPTSQLAPSAGQAMQANSKKTIPLADAQPTPQLAASDIKTTPLFSVQPTTELVPNTYNADLPTLRLSPPTTAKQSRSLPKTLMLLGASLCGIGLLILLGLQLWPLLQASDKSAANAEPQQVEVALNIVRSGVGQTPMTDQAMVYFEIENPSDQALYNVPYTMTLTSQSNKVLKNTNTIELLLPKQKIVVTDGVFTGMKFRAKSVEISLGKGYPIEITQPAPQIKVKLSNTIDLIHFGRLQESFGKEYQAYPVNPIAINSDVITATSISLLIYDAQDTVIGAGSGYIDRITNNASLNMNQRGETIIYPIIWGKTAIDRVEVTPAFSLATFNQKPPIKPKKVELDQMWLGEYIPAVDPPQHIFGTTEYPSLPPTSGYHAPAPAQWGRYDDFVSDEAMVHNLEHGAVLIFYNPQLITPMELAQLEATFDNLYRRDHHTILQKRFDLDATVAMTAWEYRLMLRDNANLDAVNTFFSEHIARGPECVNLRCPN
ncbi:DUF3105 domain-containing protein [Herpetosiphon giganteus]|uniref:DUF3105 domain-containing protein n=1 Tax=Herpetosiphon giganteus TaxID=2029754 RepID=UPI00195C3836|nr:DUF3105 domain-containing protein [Herpetosiphon giganteus]MBM7845249.1 hypothetical protein [Herpetosiphon giganteus]